MLNPILPRSTSSGGEPLTSADFPEADVIVGEDKVLLVIEDEFASAPVNKLFAPIMNLIDGLQDQIDNIEPGGSAPAQYSSSTNLSTSGLASGAPEVSDQE